MNRYVSQAILIAALIVLRVDIARADSVSEIDKVFAKWSSDATPGCAVGVANQGQKSIVRTYGSADLEHGVLNSTATVFEAGSVAKQFTAAAILLLVQDGKLALTDDVHKFVPELPDYGAAISLDHLLYHTSGLRDWQALARFTGWPLGTRLYTQTDVLDIVRRQKNLNHEPGAEVSYTTSGYLLLALIVERVSGESFFNFTRKRLFEPLEMRNTRWRENVNRIIKNRALAYGRTASGYVLDMPFENTYGSGALETTAGDLLRWNDALQSEELGRFVSRGLIEKVVLTNGQPTVYGRGLIATAYNGTEELSHSGGDQGYRSWLARYPKDGVSIAVLCNASDAEAQSLGHKVADLILQSKASQSMAGSPVKDGGALAGLYAHSRTGFPLTLRTTEQGLRSSTGELLAQGPADTLKLGELSLTKTETGFRLISPLGTLVDDYTRVAPPDESKDSYVGTYVSDEIGMTYFVVLEEGRLFLRFDRRPQTNIPLTPSYQDAFAPGNILVRFFRDQDGRVQELSLGVARLRDLRAKRVR